MADHQLTIDEDGDWSCICGADDFGADAIAAVAHANVGMAAYRWALDERTGERDAAYAVVRRQADGWWHEDAWGSLIWRRGDDESDHEFDSMSPPEVAAIEKARQGDG